MCNLQDFPHLHSQDFKLSHTPTDENLQDICDIIKSRMCRIVSDSPRVSVVFPAYNEEMYLPLMLWTLSKLVTSIPIEIIWVNNASTDRTGDIISQSWIIRVDESIKWVSYARQAWLMTAKWEIIATTDADTQVPETWIDANVWYFDRDHQLVCFSWWSEPNGGHMSYWIIRILTRILRHNLNHEISSNWSFPWHNMFYRSLQARHANGYTPGIDLWEDNLLARKMQLKGSILRVDSSVGGVLTSARRVSSLPQVLGICVDRIRRWVNVINYNDLSSYRWTFTDIR